jgi:hypothetical protein
VSAQIASLHLPSFLFQVAKEEGRPQTGEKSLTKPVFMTFPTGRSTVARFAGAGMFKTNKALNKLM